jgi:hypothetical protein
MRLYWQQRAMQHHCSFFRSASVLGEGLRRMAAVGDYLRQHLGTNPCASGGFCRTEVSAGRIERNACCSSERCLSQDATGNHSRRGSGD